MSLLYACNCRSTRSPNFQPWHYGTPDVVGAAIIDAGAAIIPRELVPEDPLSEPPKPGDLGSVPPEPDDVNVPPEPGDTVVVVRKPDGPVNPTEPVPADAAGVPIAVVIAAPCASTVSADGATIDAGVTIIPTTLTPADTAGGLQPNKAGVVVVVAIVMPVVAPVVMPVVVPVVIPGPVLRVVLVIVPTAMPVLVPGIMPTGVAGVRPVFVPNDPAVAPSVMPVVGPEVRPGGQGPFGPVIPRLLTEIMPVVPAGKGDVAGRGIGAGSVEAVTLALVPIKALVPNAALLAVTPALVAVTPEVLVPAAVIGKLAAMPLVGVMVPLIALLAVVAPMVLLVGLVAVGVVPLVALAAPVVALVGLAAVVLPLVMPVLPPVMPVLPLVMPVLPLVMPVVPLVMPVVPLAVCAMAADAPKSNVAARGRTLMAFMRGSTFP
jgi:hypothetical protein